MIERMTTGIVWDERCMWHDPGPRALVLEADGHVQPGTHVDSPEPRRRLKQLIEVSGLWDALTRVRHDAATEEEILRFHTRDYLAHVVDTGKRGGGPVGKGAAVGFMGHEIALLAAGGVVAAADRVARGELANAYALVRPAGHHAEPEGGMGFCVFCNAAVAARHLGNVHRVERIALVDWDVHHGNGAERGFWTDPGVLTISLHQEGGYPPGSGSVDAIGAGPGEGYNMNIPLPAGCGTGAYLAAFEQIVLPALDAYRPQTVIVACGFDAGMHDPMGRMMLHSDSFRELTRLIRESAVTHCQGRLVMCQEGGYCPTTVPFYGLAVMEALSGTRTSVCDPMLAMYRDAAGQSLTSAQARLIREMADFFHGLPWRKVRSNRTARRSRQADH